MNIERIAEGHVDETIEQATQPVVIDFWMDDCPPCNMMAPKLKAVAKAYEGRVKVYQVKVEEGSALLAQYDVEAMPTILFFREGALVTRVEALVHSSELFFIHTEASDRQVATMLTEMMGPQVVLAPRLAETPASLRAEVYVFQNGVEGMGPFGYQPDVFSSVPGTEGYSPLRAIHLVSWNADAVPRELCSVEEVHAAASRGEITINESGVVVNMPVLVWPGGHR